MSCCHCLFLKHWADIYKQLLLMFVRVFPGYLQDEAASVVWVEEATEVGYSWSISTSLLLFAGGVLWLSSSENMCPGRAVGWQSCAHLAHQSSSRLHNQGSTRSLSLTSESMPVETVICTSLGYDESQIRILREWGSTIQGIFYMQDSYCPASLSLSTSFFIFCEWANGREHWSQLNGLEEA